MRKSRAKRRRPARSADMISVSTTPDRHGQRPILRHEQAGDADRSIDASPLIAIEIERDKNVTRKHRRVDLAHSPGVPHRLDAARQKIAEALRGEPHHDSRFLIWQRVREIPAFPWAKLQLGNCLDRPFGAQIMSSDLTWLPQHGAVLSARSCRNRIKPLARKIAAIQAGRKINKYRGEIKPLKYCHNPKARSQA